MGQVEMMILSICIPTYNFGKWISQSLDAFIPQLNTDIEIVVVDGGSTDNTEQIVLERSRKNSNIRYIKLPIRGGIDRDMALAVAEAKGKYCWLFSADDVVMPDAIQNLLFEFNSNHDVYLSEHVICSSSMVPKHTHPVFSSIRLPHTFNLEKSEDRTLYFEEARTSEAYFSFLSGPIFLRDAWMRAEPVNESFYGTCWAHAGRLLSLAHSRLSVRYLGKTLLFSRSDNDSFRDRGLVNRIGIAIEGYQHIVSKIFGLQSFEHVQLRRVLRNEIGLDLLLLAKLRAAQNPKIEDAARLDQLVLSIYSQDKSLANRLRLKVFQLAPLSMVNAAFLGHSLLKGLTKTLKGA